jgi:very-short-patch-repair endonuclease
MKNQNIGMKKNELVPRQVFKNSNSKFIFKCNNCIHEFDIELSNLNNGCWCPYCANKKTCNNKICKYCFENSFASHEKAKYWSNKNNLKPINVMKGTHQKFYFNCSTCNHEFISSIVNITKKNTWCNFCALKELCDKQECKYCFQKSFASHEKAKYWSNKNELKAMQVFKSSGKKYWFKCIKNHEFESQLRNIINGCWCPYCVNKTEQKLYDKLITLYPTLQQQFKVDWCKNKTFLPFDFAIPENKIIIELDGRQHFEQVRNWDDPKKTQENDKYKMKCANDNNYSVIRILQGDVFYDSYDWLYELNDNIKNIIKNKKVKNIYMCKDNEYDVFN